MADNILFDQTGDLVTITLNNPDKLNCMGMEMLRMLDEAIVRAADDQTVKVLLIRGAGDRAFSTGADLKEYKSLTPVGEQEWLVFGNRVFDKLEQLPKPTVALIKGYAVGGGLELALACDFRLGTETAVLSLPELQHGWLPGWGGMERLRRLFGEARAKEIVMLSEKIPAREAFQYGLLTKLLEPGMEQEELRAFLDHLASIDPEVFRQAKSVLTMK